MKNKILIPPNDPIIQKLKTAAIYAAMDRKAQGFSGKGTVGAWFIAHSTVIGAKSRLIKYRQGINNEKVDPTIFQPFLQRRREIIARIERTLRSDQTIKKIVFTGHFFAGALAVLFALDIKNALEEAGISLKYDIEAITFASPRIGNLQFAQYVNLELRDKTFRVTHGDSLYPEIFKTTDTFHHEREYWINDQESCLCAAEGENNLLPKVYECFGVVNPNGIYIGESEVFRYFVIYYVKMMVNSESNKATCFTLCVWSSLRNLRLDIINKQPSLMMGVENNSKTSCLKSFSRWTLEEKKTMIEAHKMYGKNWKLISAIYLPSRTPMALSKQWHHLESGGTVDNKDSHKWTPKEDIKLELAAKKYFTSRGINWVAIKLTGCFPKRSARDLCDRYHRVLARSKRKFFFEYSTRIWYKLVKNNLFFQSYTKPLHPSLDPPGSSKRDPWKSE
ncbi:hypothetical protein G9A89_023478 [Geosiphon pyriformis]|nr:hypothetical protein G9A89_023478 [Geosiphon pyriformis]